MAAGGNKACLNIPWPRDPPVVQSKIMLWEPCDIHAQDAANARQWHFLDLRALCLANPNSITTADVVPPGGRLPTAADDGLRGRPFLPGTLSVLLRAHWLLPEGHAVRGRL